MPETANVKLTLEKGYNYAMVITKGKRERVKAQNGVIELAIGSGEGRFIVPLK